MDEQAVRPDVSLTTEVDGADAVVRIDGELDAYSAPSLEEEVARLVATGVSSLVVDLSETAFLDSSGLRAILGAEHAITAGDGRFALRAPSTAVSRLLDIAGLTEQFVIES